MDLHGGLSALFRPPLIPGIVRADGAKYLLVRSTMRSIIQSVNLVLVHVKVATFLRVLPILPLHQLLNRDARFFQLRAVGVHSACAWRGIFGLTVTAPSSGVGGLRLDAIRSAEP